MQRGAERRPAPDREGDGEKEGKRRAAWAELPRPKRRTLEGSPVAIEVDEVGERAEMHTEAGPLDLSTAREVACDDVMAMELDPLRENQMLRSTIRQLEKKMEALRALGDADTQLARIAKMRLASASKELKAIRGEAEQRKALDEKCARAEMEATICREELDHCKNAIRAEQADTAASRRRVRQLEKSHQLMEAENVSLKERIAQLEDMQKSVQVENANLKKRMAEMESVGQTTLGIKSASQPGPGTQGACRPDSGGTEGSLPSCPTAVQRTTDAQTLLAGAVCTPSAKAAQMPLTEGSLPSCATAAHRPMGMQMLLGGDVQTPPAQMPCKGCEGVVQAATEAVRRAIHIQVTRCAGSGWASIAFRVLDAIEQISEKRDREVCPGFFFRQARLVNRHWNGWANKATLRVGLASEFSSMNGPSRSAILRSVKTKFPNVEELMLPSGFKFTMIGAHFLSTLSKLRHVELRDCPLMDTQLSWLKGLVGLRSLRIRKSRQSTGPGWEAIGGLVALRELHLEDVKVGRNALWTKMPSLRKLELRLAEQNRVSEHSKDGAEGWHRVPVGVSRQPALTELTISKSFVTKADLAQWRDLCALTSLTLVDILYRSDHPRDRHFSGLGALHGLRFLGLTRCHGRMGFLAKLTSLQSLMLEDCNGARGKGMGMLTNLTSLSIVGCSMVKDADAKGLVALTGLRRLRVSKCGLTSSGLETLTSMAPGVVVDSGW
eukprot:evm.model.scf_951.1 EVM.evm.TU.scf_951.1   scf_951:13954-32019(-)